MRTLLSLKFSMFVQLSLVARDVETNSGFACDNDAFLQTLKTIVAESEKPCFPITNRIKNTFTVLFKQRDLFARKG